VKYPIKPYNNNGRNYSPQSNYAFLTITRHTTHKLSSISWMIISPKEIKFILILLPSMSLLKTEEIISAKNNKNNFYTGKK